MHGNFDFKLHFRYVDRKSQSNVRAPKVNVWGHRFHRTKPQAAFPGGVSKCRDFERRRWGIPDSELWALKGELYLALL